MNKQPYYHRAVILFTATEHINAGDLSRALSIKHRALVKGSVDVEESDSEADDPSDLM